MRRLLLLLLPLALACGAGDTGAPDSAASDTGPLDSGLPDTGPPDTGPTDTGPLDTGLFDTGLADSGPADTGPPDTGPADVGPPDTGVRPLPSYCADASVPPATIDCAGIYTDVAAKELADGVMPFAPAAQLWSDGASKQRWIALPPGTTIDTSNANEWIFPVGTKLWKEFSLGGRRVETRLWHKVQSNYWVHATYAWNADETQARIHFGGDIALGTGTYHIPRGDECEQCHRGATDRILGFEQVSLGLPEATGLTLERLAASHLISTAPQQGTALRIGDDGTRTASAAMAWLHINCGRTCHNGNSNSTAYPAGMRLRLDPLLLDGRSSALFDTRATTIGTPVFNENWAGQQRIHAADPDGSWLVFLISNREVGLQMPPIATSTVDRSGVALVRRWIAAMPAPPDAGVPDSGFADAGFEDSGIRRDSGVATAVALGGVADGGRDSGTSGRDASSPVDSGFVVAVDASPDAGLADPDASPPDTGPDLAPDAQGPDASSSGDAAVDPPDAGG